MHRMTAFPQLRPTYRASRLRVTDFTPVVLRFQNGGCTTGNIEVISLTGGLLCLSKPIDRGSCVKLMFLSQNGPVLGTAELLSPAQIAGGHRRALENEHTAASNGEQSAASNGEQSDRRSRTRVD